MEINLDQTIIKKLTHEIAPAQARLKFSKRSEQMNPTQASQFDDLIVTDIATIEANLRILQTTPAVIEKKAKAHAHGIANRLSTKIDPPRVGQYSLLMRPRP